ncbi:unnamed protein product, partial [Phaeothamnion confervicola]
FSGHPSTAAATAAAAAAARIIKQPFTNHNGGWMAFRPSDYRGHGPDQTSHILHVSTGDGGGENDPANSAQTLTSLLGKMLRICVRTDVALGDSKYTIPDDNPLVGAGDGVREEIYAWGLRNPWRCSFDMVTDDLWCGDVGQEKIEEVDLIVAGGNYGWGQWEGERCNTAGSAFSACDSVSCFDTVVPKATMCHFGYEPTGEGLPADACSSEAVRGNSITGGYVYRGQKY